MLGGGGVAILLLLGKILGLRGPEHGLRERAGKLRRPGLQRRWLRLRLRSSRSSRRFRPPLLRLDLCRARSSLPLASLRTMLGAHLIYLLLVLLAHVSKLYLRLPQRVDDSVRELLLVVFHGNPLAIPANATHQTNNAR